MLDCWRLGQTSAAAFHATKADEAFPSEENDHAVIICVLMRTNQGYNHMVRTLSPQSELCFRSAKRPETVIDLRSDKGNNPHSGENFKPSLHRLSSRRNQFVDTPRRMRSNSKTRRIPRVRYASPLTLRRIPSVRSDSHPADFKYRISASWLPTTNDSVDWIPVGTWQFIRRIVRGP